MINETEITTLDDAYHLAWYMSVEIAEESVYDSLPWAKFTVFEFASVLTEAGVISSPLADKYITKFGGDTDSDMWDPESDQFRYLTQDRIDWDNEEDWRGRDYENKVESHQALFAAAAILCNDEYRKLVFKDLAQYVEEYSDEDWFKTPSLSGIKDRTQGRACYDLPGDLPIHHR